MKKILFLALLMAVPFHSCTTTKKMADNERQEGHFRLYSFPDKKIEAKYDTNRFKKIVIVSSNDFEGNINPKNFVIKNKFDESRLLKVGGLTAMRAYTDIFRKEFKDAVVHVDAGSFLNPEKNHLYTIFLYNYLNVDVATLGLNEFSLKTRYDNFIDYINLIGSKSKFKLVASNLFDLRKASPIKWKNFRSSYIKKVNGIKIGFIGITPQIISKKIADNKINGIHIQNEAKNIILKSNSLRKSGAKVIVLLTSSPIDCSSKIAHARDIEPEKVNFNPYESAHCDIFKNQLLKTLTLIPKNSIDAIVTSGEKSKVANFINGYPVLQNAGEGRYLSWMELYFDTKLHTITKEKTTIHQPVQLCHQFFKSSQDCYTKENFEDEEIMPATFLGHKVEIKPVPIY
jgi:2',3'-cyclic-nucleotide 2'-phosphodiesterase (5'-nucleotidase family)